MSPSGPPTIVWLRKDLRLADNPALVDAAFSGAPVIPLYIHDEEGPPRAMGAASRWWLDKSLRALGAGFRELGAALVLRRGGAMEVIGDVVKATGARRVVWNRLYDRKSIARDDAVAAALKKGGVESESFNASLLNEPDAVLTGSGGPYRVFTPYWKAAAPLAAHAEPLRAPGRLAPPASRVASEDIDEWALHPTKPDWSSGFQAWTPGEDGARRRLAQFLGDAAERYAKGRDMMGEQGVSQLSPHLHFGEIGPRQVWASAREAADQGASHRDIETYLKELGWREFNYSLLFNYPEITHRPFNPAFAGFQWRDDPESFKAWTRGLTGYPVVDAAMRQLWSTGWMHNRARMIAASFLIKDLMIDWREGEAWFWDTLVDADMANNVANWQWVAGSGADAAPFFRIFNPMLQGAKFDPEGAYVRRWVPELANLSDTDIHQPWKADAAALRTAGVELGVTYPQPIVDHFAARDNALAAYARLS